MSHCTAIASSLSHQTRQRCNCSAIGFDRSIERGNLFMATSITLEQRCFFSNINRTQAAEIDLDLHTRPSIRARDQTCLPCEFGANPFSGSRDISYTNKKVTDSATNRTLRSSLNCVRVANCVSLNLFPLAELIVCLIFFKIIDSYNNPKMHNAKLSFTSRTADYLIRREHSRLTTRNGNNCSLNGNKNVTLNHLKLKYILKNVKGKGFPYSIPSVGPAADPGVQAVSHETPVRDCKSSTRR